MSSGAIIGAIWSRGELVNEGKLQVQLLRSVIFVPGNRPNMLERARTFNSDIVLIDLEDSVPPAEKAAARELAAEWVPNLSSDGRNVMVRVNSLETGMTRQEIDAIIGPELVGISIGKSESTWEIQEVDRIVSAAETRSGVEPGQIKLIPWIENASAVMAAQQIALASPRVIAIAFGAEDYTNDMGIERTDSGEEGGRSQGHGAHRRSGCWRCLLGLPLRSLSGPRGPETGLPGLPALGIHMASLRFTPLNLRLSTTVLALRQTKWYTPGR